MVVFYEKAK